MARRKSPLKVVCKTLLLGIKRCDWTPVGPFRGAEFVGRDSPNTAIVHPSTKHDGKWQVSYFDDRGPVGDSQHPSASEALKQVSPRRWKLRGF